jgi:NifU-like protein involved in Fe-S cluster formation
MEAEAGVYIGEAGTDANGDRLRFYLRVDGECIKAVKFQANGTVATIACSQYVAEFLEGRLLSEISSLDAVKILEELELSNLKIHSAILVIRALNSIEKKGDK